MKSKMRKKLIAFMLCMVLVICNSVSILADAPAAATTTTEKQVKETGTAKSEGASEEEKSADDEKDTSEQSDEESAPETETTEKKEETTEATPEDKEDATTEATTEAEEGTSEAAESSDKDETTGAEETATIGNEEETSEAPEETSESAEETSTEGTEETKQSPAYDGKYEDSTVTISVSAEAGIVPEGVELSVTPIVKTDITDDMSDEDKMKAEKVNAQYDLTEKKLAEDSEANEEAMEGFLAYDISFIVDGEEVEPNGDVKVVMDFKEAAVPDGVSENATVVVKHLKENGESKDEVVVEDMTGDTVIETLPEDETGNAVKKVELQSDNFSTYTVTWYGQDRSLELHYIDSNGNDIAGRNGAKTINVNEVVQLEDFNTTIPNYTYQETYIRTDRQEIGVDSIRVLGEQNQGMTTYKVQYHAVEDNIWYDWNVRWNSNYSVYFKYNYTNDFKLSSIDTEDTEGLINLKLFDYDITEKNKYVGNMKNFQFGTGTGSGANGWTHSAETYPGILRSNMLTDGEGNYTYPQLASDFGSDNFSQLFSGDKASRKNVYEANKLFTLDSDGYYEYDSYKNYAYYDKINHEFIVYNVPATVKSISSTHGTVPGFFPFNKIEKNRKRQYEFKDGYLNATPNDSAPDNAYTSDTNYWFGMSMDATFVQPEDGEVNNNDMIFDFAGDDDVWVFIDGVLVLDIGGIHNEAGGSINFKTGEVYVNGKSQGTLQEIFRRAGRDTSTGFTTNGTFEDYTAHTINFYYLERGAGASDCRLKFNLEIIPEGEIRVEKQLEEETDPVLYGDVEFGFELYVENSDEDGQGTGTLEKVTTTTEGSYGYGAIKRNSSGGEESLTINNDGVFYLKPGETAIFENIPKNLNYKVVEVDIQSDEFDEVYVNSTKVTENYADETTNTEYTADSGEDTIANRPWVIFTNSCNAKNLRTLTIKKVMETDQSDDFFTVNVKIENSNFVGSYRLINEDGKTIDASGNVQQDTYRLSTDNGNIQLKAGWEIYIYNILSETEFEVTEVNLDTTSYDNPSYAVCVDEKTTTTSQTSAKGEIVLDHHALVTVTNSFAGQIQVSKDWIGVTDTDFNNETVYVGLYLNGNPVAADKTLTLDENNDWIGSFNGVAGTGYSVKELRPVNVDAESGETAEFTIEGQGYVGIDEGDSITINDIPYIVDYGDFTKDSVIDKQQNITIKNVRKWQIVKRSSSDGNPKLSDANFTLTERKSLGDTAEPNIYTGTSDDNGVITWSGTNYTGLIPDGTYILEETKAPTGYILGGTWTITISNGIPTAIIGDPGEVEGNAGVTIGEVTFYNQNGILTLYYDNEVLYELPSAGGPGVHWYTLGGTLLMAGAALIVYRQKRKREVLLRK